MGVIVIDVHMLIVAILLVIAVRSDLETCRIRNRVTYGFMLLGLIYNIMDQGLSGLPFSVQGLLLPALCLLLLYMIKAIGAGDIKLLCAVGAVMGPGYVLHTMLFSFLCGGIMSLLLILFRHNGQERLRHFLLYAGTCLFAMRLMEYSDLSQRSDGSKFHFSLAVSMGTVAAAVIGKLGMTFF